MSHGRVALQSRYPIRTPSRRFQRLCFKLVQRLSDKGQSAVIIHPHVSTSEMLSCSAGTMTTTSIDSAPVLAAHPHHAHTTSRAPTASDQAAQSDTYSAATIAGVIGTDCVVLAGPRDTEMPSVQAARLEVAASDGYLVGGASAVPADKTEGRFLVRVGGADRWATACLVGEVTLQQAGTTTPTRAEICEYRSLVGTQR